MLCCVCLLSSTKMLAIFDEEGINLNIGDTVEKYFWFKTHPSNLLTSQICTVCWTKIEDFHKFYTNVERVHKSFQEYQLVQDENHDNTAFEHDKEIVIDVELITKIPEEKNPLENDNLQSNTNDEEDNEPEDESNEEMSKNRIKENKIQRTSKKRGLSKKSDKTKKKYDKSFHQLDRKLTAGLVKKHIPMTCNLCIFSGATFSDIVKHFKKHHAKVQPYIMCCNRKFNRSHRIDQHAIIHENPDSFRCNDCNRSFTTTYGLQTHDLIHHAPEEKRTHACEFCPRRFGRRKLLELHRQTHIPKENWTITCTKCTTRTVKFVSQYLLNIHNSQFHSREASICHVCAKEIKDRKSFEKHVRAHFEDSGPRVKCSYPNCDRWLKDADNLRTHMQLHNLAGKLYQCSECNKECPNRRALTKHMRYYHSTPRFSCEQCDKTFRKAVSLQEHMAQHTSDTL